MSISPAAVQALANNDLENFLVAASPGGIERQEAAGQVRFVNDTNLPQDIRPECKAALEAAGVVFTDEVVDNIFVKATLPEGWMKKATDHSMWSDLLDEKGRKRASMFFKAAFYDYNAHMSANRRYSISRYVGVNADGTPAADDNYQPDQFETWVTDCNEKIHRIGVRDCNDYGAGNAHDALAKAWLNANYPEWENAAAYW